VVAFPEELPASIEAFRSQFDPLGAVVPAHVTFVFPFASSLSVVQVAAHVRKVAARWPRLPIMLAGVDAYAGRWVHLRITRGRAAIAELHDRLYRGALAPFLRREFDYEPHVTLARAEDAPGCDAMVVHARATFTRPLEAVLRSLAVVALPHDGRVVVEREIGLGG
jgi:2'-5' RNA ligase